jgi:hypothetical protein
VESGRFGVCAAYSTILMAVVFGTILLMNLALNKMGVSKSDDSIL